MWQLVVGILFSHRRQELFLLIFYIYFSVLLSVVDPDPQGSGTFAGSVTRDSRIRVHIQKWM
jgi:hypothetical protein